MKPRSAQHIELSDLPDSHCATNGLRLAQAINPLHQVKATLQVCVGSATLTVGELLAAVEQQVLVLDRGVEQPVDLMLEGQVVARGQLVAVDDQFAVRITELPLALSLDGSPTA
jgi:flagellar motor switch protein FliN/FliY